MLNGLIQPDHLSWLDKVVLTDADEAARHIATERPEEILHAVGQALDHFVHFEFHKNLRGVFALDGRRHVGRLSEHGDFLAVDVRIRSLGRGALGFSVVRFRGNQREGCDHEHAKQFDADSQCFCFHAP